jgi:hypothetical protein
MQGRWKGGGTSQATRMAAPQQGGLSLAGPIESLSVRERGGGGGGGGRGCEMHQGGNELVWLYACGVGRFVE